MNDRSDTAPAYDATRIRHVLGCDADTARDRVLTRTRRYVEHETPSRDESALVALADTVQRDVEALGATVERHAAPGLGVNLSATIAGADDGARPLAVLCHIDTVHPVRTLARQPFAIRDGRATGPGVYDMKCGLALAIEAIAVLRERGGRARRPVRLLVTCDEEIGSHSARAHIEALARAAAAVLVPEPAVPGGGVKTARKGVATYDLRVTGRAAHAGTDPGQGVSAITELAHQIVAVLALADHELGTTLNIGTLTGGTASNVVAAEAQATVDLRSATADEYTRVHAALLSLEPHLAGAEVRVGQTELRPPLVRTPDVVRLYEHTRTLAAELGHDLAEGASGGGSDGSIAAAAGAPVLDGLGADGGGAHAAHEHILIGDLPFRLALWVRLLETL